MLEPRALSVLMFDPVTYQPGVKCCFELKRTDTKEMGVGLNSVGMSPRASNVLVSPETDMTNAWAV